MERSIRQVGRVPLARSCRSDAWATPIVSLFDSSDCRTMMGMGYVPLLIEDMRWPQVARFIRGPLESLYFRDAHDLLRLPQRDAGLTGGCNFAIARVLLSAVSSLSTALYATGAGDSGYHSAFCNMLVRFYPWDTENEPPRMTRRGRRSQRCCGWNTVRPWSIHSVYGAARRPATREA